MEHLITVHYGELALKGQNRGQFEKILTDNIKSSLKNEKHSKIERKQLRILIHLSEDSDRKSIIERLKKVFGIKWFSYAISCKPEIEEIKTRVLENAAAHRGKTVKVVTKRSDKSFSLNSMEISKQIGQSLFDSGFKINVKKPDGRIEEIGNVNLKVL